MAETHSKMPALRTEIAASWRRVAAGGLDRGSGADIPPLDVAAVEQRRERSGLAEMLPLLRDSLRTVVAAGQLVVVTDSRGRVLWQMGDAPILSSAEDLGFVRGSAWTEANVGTNAIGTALVLGEPVQVRGAEHFVDAHTRWGCAAAPLKDIWTGRTLGVVDVSGPSRTLHPAELALVEATARLVSAELMERHRFDLDRLRARAAPVLARLGGEVLAVDRHGRLAAAIGVQAPDRVALPSDIRAGEVWLPTIGAAVAEPFDDGWLLRLDTERGVEATEVVLSLIGEPSLAVCGPAGEWSRRLSPRHAEIVIALIEAGDPGRTAGQLAQDVFGEAGQSVTIRAKMSRLRRLIGSVLSSNPYRLTISASIELPDDRSAVLPRSGAPVVQRVRRQCG